MRNLLLLSILSYALCQPTKERYCVIIDAGSSGTRVHIYQFLRASSDSLPVVFQKAKVLKTKVALSSFLRQPRDAGASLAPLIKYAQEQVPNSNQADSTVHLLATAGMRLLAPADIDSILESCREVLFKSPFKFQKEWASMLPGSTEGIYGFIAANYASGALEQPTPDPESLLGVVELGGASLQVTFMINSAAEKVEARHVQAGSLDLTVFTHSFLGLGQDAAQHEGLQLAKAKLKADTEKMAAGRKSQRNGSVHEEMKQQILDPCIPQGFEGSIDGVAVSGGGYFSLCRQVSSSLVAGNCTSHHCGLRGLQLPQLSGKFLCIENLQYTAGFLGLPKKATMRELVEAAEKVCAVPWTEMLKRYPSYEPEHLLNYCFGAAYGVALMHDGFGIDMDDASLLFTETITSKTGKSVVLDWTLGAMVVAASMSSLITSLDREFPIFNPGATVKRAPSGDQMQSRGLLPGVKVVSLLVVILLVAGFSLRYSSRKRMRRKHRSKRLLGNSVQTGDCRMFNYWDSEEEADSESPHLPNSLASGQNLGRRANTGKSGDLEQGNM